MRFNESPKISYFIKANATRLSAKGLQVQHQQQRDFLF